MMVLIWGANYSVIKRAFDEIPPQAFNAIRMVIASAVFLVAIRIARRRARRASGPLSRVFHSPHPLTTADRWRLLWLGLIGQFVYQICFVGGVAGTSVSNSALIIGATPVVVAVVSAIVGREHIGKLHWLGAAISALGIYLVVGHGTDFGGAHWRGDVLVMISVACWAVYSIGAAPLMKRHSPLFVTGRTFMIGCVPYVIFAGPALMRVDWWHVNPWAWVAVVVSALLALCVAYLIWYMAIQAIGVARTSLYSNLVPIVAMTVAWAWLGEPMTPLKATGATAVVTGLFLTRLGRKAGAMPPEE